MMSDRQLAKKLGETRMRLLHKQPFFAILLLQTRFGLDDQLSTAATDGQYILFNPDFLTQLSTEETEFVLLHEILHIALEHCFRKLDREPTRFNIACDIVVNATILEQTHLKLTSIANEEILHTVPDGRSGTLFSVEEVYALLPPSPTSNHCFHDDHSQWPGPSASILEQQWKNSVLKAALSVEQKNYDTIPLMAQRLLTKLRTPILNWRTLLYNFVKQELYDYTFMQPDRRFQDSPFMLPGFAETREHGDIWIAVDTSGSVDDEQLAKVWSEIQSAIQTLTQTIWVSFFDAAITEPIRCTRKNFPKIQPMGGGGTSFETIFNYLAEHRNFRPDCIVIMTDGYAPFPDKKKALQIPVLWLIYDQNNTAPWGKTVRVID